MYILLFSKDNTEVIDNVCADTVVDGDVVLIFVEEEDEYKYHNDNSIEGCYDDDDENDPNI